MKLMSFLIALFVLCALCGVPFAHAQGYTCTKRNCMNDPDAWSAALGARPQDRQAQVQARDAAGALVTEQSQAVGADLLQGMPPRERQKLLYQLEGQLAVLSKKDVVVVSASVSAIGAGYLFCGSALYDPDDSGIFVLDTRPGALATLHADRATYRQAGCERTGIALR